MCAWQLWSLSCLVQLDSCFIFRLFQKRLHHSHLHNSPLSGLRQAPQCPPCLAFIISFHDNFMTISYELKSFFVLNDLGLQPFLQIRTQGGKKRCVCVIGRWLLTHQAAHFLSLPHATGNELCPHNLYITKQHVTTDLILFIVNKKINLKNPADLWVCGGSIWGQISSTVRRVWSYVKKRKEKKKKHFLTIT